MWVVFSKAVVYWADMKDPYVTYHNDYIESVWWALKEIWNKGLLYKGHKIVPYCPRCGTPLSSHEVAQGYKDVKEKSAFVRFKAKGEDAYFLAWTTTPWTLPSNLALCVNPEITYVKVKQGDYTYYMAKELCEKVLGEDYTILEEMPGKSLEYKEYEPLYPYALNKLNGKKAFIVTCDDYVTTTDGSGIVHMAPAFGEDDSRVCREYGIAFVQFVDAKGCMTADTDWPGVFVKKADPKILKDLEEKGLLFSAPNFEHSYPHCWRCDTPLLYYARETWFIRMTAVRDKLIANNKTINWIPESIGKGRFGDWLEHVQDWGLSRNRYWGTPLNIWECECGHQHAIGSIEELKSMSDNCPDDIELHRPFIDAVTIKCPHCGKEMHRVPEVIDCWFDSGSMPFAQWHYPFENKELFEEQFPADFISEAVDQTRGWFYSLIAISTLLFDKAPYKNVIVLGHVLDAQGRKMSKSLGNGIDPVEVIEKYGADTLRFMLITGNTPGNDMRFYWERVESARNFANKLWNASRFMLMNLEGFDKTFVPEARDYTLADKWILSRYAKTAISITENLEKFELGEAGRSLYDFIWNEFCDWYIELSKARLYDKENVRPRKVAQYVLGYVLEHTLRLLHPFMPFITEEIWQHIPHEGKSIMVADWPTGEEAKLDDASEVEMTTIMETIKAIRNMRAEVNAAPSKKTEVILHLSDESLTDVFTKNSGYLETLASAKNVTILAKDDAKPENAMTAVVNGVEIYLPLAGLIDVEKETARLNKELATLDKEVSRLDKKLSNAGFIAKAPADIVEKEKEKLKGYEEKREAVKQRLAYLATL